MEKVPNDQQEQNATYKINNVKDSEGNNLSSVKVYVDDVYVHHYAPETLIFCSGCSCDGYVSCDFGTHKIHLERTGYETWSETKSIKSADYFEVNPVMSKMSQNDQVSIPTYKLTPTSEVKSIMTTSEVTEVNEEFEDNNDKDIDKPIRITEDEVLGIRKELASDNFTQENGNEKSENEFPVDTAAIMLGGVSFLGAGTFPFVRKWLKNRKNNDKSLRKDGKIKL